MKAVTLALVLLLGMVTGAAALKWSDKNKVDIATKAIQMADTLAAGTPTDLICRANMPRADLHNQQAPAPTVILQSGTQAFTTLLTAMTNKLNADKATAQTYLTSVGVTND